MYKHQRRVALGAMRADGSQGRGIEEVAATPLLADAGRSGAKVSQRSEESALGYRAIVPPAEHDGELSLTAASDSRRPLAMCLDDHVRIHLPAVFRWEGIRVDDLVDALEVFADARPLRSPLYEATVSVAAMIGRVVHSKADDDFDVEFDDEWTLKAPPSADDPIRTRLRTLPARLIRLVAAVWLARWRANLLQRRSDAGLFRLAALQEAVQANSSWEWLMRWSEATRWNVGRDAQARPGTAAVGRRPDALDWNAGLADTWRIVRFEEEALRLAVKTLADVVNGSGGFGGGEPPGLVAVGLVAVFNPVHAAKLIRGGRRVASLQPADVVAGCRAPKPRFEKFDDMMLREVARRRGWLLAGIDERTLIERTIALAAGVSADAVADAATDFGETGDPSKFVKMIGGGGVVDEQTRYTLSVDGYDQSAAAATCFGRAAMARLGFEVAPVRTTFAEALFYQHPKYVVGELTELKGAMSSQK